MSRDNKEVPQTQSGGKISCQKNGKTFSSPEFGVTPKCPRVYIKTFGCQMNTRDSEVICGLLKNAGYRIIADPEDADIVILNTCSVRQHAEDRVWSAVGMISRPAKKIVGLVGCMAQSYKERVFKRAPAVDFVVGPQDIHKIPGIIKELSKEKWGLSPQGDCPHFSLERKIWETDGSARPDEVYHTGHYFDPKHAYVVISEGCSNFCSYCVVPYTRGPLRHRNYKDILREIEEAADKGITSVTLLGQNVCAYGADNREQSTENRKRITFVKLLELVNRIKGLKEFGFITSHPRDTTVDLFKTMAGLDKLKKSLHLPVQSGSDRILKAMNRGYCAKFYLDLADNYRRIVKGGALSTDIIVGFPSEAEDDFRDTYRLLEDARFDAGFIFKYSPRPHAGSSGLPDDVPQKEKERRHKVILDLQRGISKKYAESGY
ncbi:MAG: tRNA (N6-isopentenyl adenosine(37)-C2)-methylthiotransferase MiaB [Candidatus Omnitrophota bacterium]